MRATLRQHGQQGQAAVLLALAMVGLLAIVGLALDGGMLYWNQRRAQNGADAAAIAGVTALVDDFTIDGIACGSSETPILDRVYEYASVNDVPDAATGDNVEAFYLTEDGSGNRVILTHTDGSPWQVGDTGTIPCEDIVGLHVRASFPQQTFLAGIIGIVETNVTVEASAEWTFSSWCGDFVIYARSQRKNNTVLQLSGASTRIYGGGIHSNGGIHVTGGGGIIDFDDGAPIEYGPGSPAQIDLNKIADPDPIISTPPYEPLPNDFFYRWEDFIPPNGRFYLEAVRDGIPVHDFRGQDIDKDEEVRGGNKNGQLVPGLYITDGDVKLSSLTPGGGKDPGNIGSTDRPWQVTFVALGSVQISGGINQIPAVANTFIFAAEDGRHSDALDSITDTVIKLSGDSSMFNGMVVAPLGGVDYSGSKNTGFDGQIFGWDVNFTGSDTYIAHDTSLCPFIPPQVLLIQ